MHTWTCLVELSDGRCPDGCCGHVTAKVTSPVTGRAVRLDSRLLPGTAYPRIVEAVLAAPSSKRRNLECRQDLTGSAQVILSREELQTILANEDKGESF